jgi:hypothetical protein
MQGIESGVGDRSCHAPVEVGGGRSYRLTTRGFRLMSGMANMTLASFQRFLRVLGARMLPFVLRDGRPDPARRALMIRHPMPSGLPDVTWYFDDAKDIEGWWRMLGTNWKAKQDQLDAVVQHYRGALPDERQRMEDWAATSLEDRLVHPWSAALTVIEQQYTTDTVELPKAWRSWTAREYIKSCCEVRSDDMVGDVIAACVANSRIAAVTRKRQSHHFGG